MKLTEFPVTTSTNGSDLLWIMQSGVSKQITYTNLIAGAQTAHASLTALAALSGTGIVERTGTNTFAVFSISSLGKSLVAGAGASDMRTTLGLGTSATLDVPASGNAASGEVVKGSDTRLSDARTPASHTHTASAITDFSSAVVAALGTAAPLNVAASGDATSGQVVKGNDSRLTNTRTPASHTHTVSEITDAGTAALVDVPATGNASVTEAVIGSDTRLTNARTPSAHATSHSSGGSDPITVSNLAGYGTFAGSTLTLAGIVVTFPTVAGKVAYQDGVTAASGVSTNATINLSEPSQCYTLTLSQARTLIFTGQTEGRSFKLRITENATGGYSVTWPAIKWASGTPPTQTTGADKSDLYEFTYISGVWIGRQTVKDFS